jgi:hypothetical protein
MKLDDVLAGHAVRGVESINNARKVNSPKQLQGAMEGAMQAAMRRAGRGVTIEKG